VTASLARTLRYRNASVVHKFCERYALRFSEASEVFLETKRWLWLVAQSEAGGVPPVPLTLIGYPQLTVVDEMWHTFILFTEPYTTFCQTHFGRYIHHAPATHAERTRSMAERRRDPAAFDHARLEDFRRQARYVGERLGPATVRKWFRTYAQKYSAAALDRLLIPHTAPVAFPINERVARSARHAER
jgi:hypothetical protein